MADLEHVQEAMIAHKKQGTWIEITNLVIPGYNDSNEQLSEMIQWIIDNLGQVPVHFSRFHPSYKMMDAPITSEKILENAARIAEKKGLDYVYVGNIRHEKENTHCHNCGHLVIERSGYVIKNTDLNKKGKTCHCPACSEKIPLAGMQWSGII